MRRLALFLCFLLIAAGVAGQDAPSPRRSRQFVEPVADARLDRLERWLKAVARHAPGVADPQANEVAGWSQPDLQSLWIDVNVLVKLMRNPRDAAIQHAPRRGSAHRRTFCYTTPSAATAEGAGLCSGRPHC